MSRKSHPPEQIINKLRQAEVELAKGATVAQTCKKIGVTDQTYYRWRSEYGGMRVDQAQRHVRLSCSMSPLSTWLAPPPPMSTWPAIEHFERVAAKSA